MSCVTIRMDAYGGEARWVENGGTAKSRPDNPSPHEETYRIVGGTRTCHLGKAHRPSLLYLVGPFPPLFLFLFYGVPTSLPPIRILGLEFLTTIKLPWLSLNC